MIQMCNKRQLVVYDIAHVFLLNHVCLDTILLLKLKERNFKKQNMHGAARLREKRQNLPLTCVHNSGSVRIEGFCS